VSAVSVERFQGAAVMPHLSALAALRIEVFREYPYLYDGSLAYEQRYLESYAACARSVVVIARDADRVIGASTALPLLDHGETQSQLALFRGAGIDPERVFYFGESVLRSAYRGQRLGHAFFDQREAAAREQGFGLAAFCAVQRPDTHPQRPHDYVPHDAFWRKRGYVRMPALRLHFAWRDLGDASESEKPMVVWIKELLP
jgi:GNAT superfamily N-acetyltransferase